MKKIFSEYKLLLRNVPSLVVAMFVVSVVVMNLLASKTLFMVGDWFAMNAGVIVSWIAFIAMDVVTKHFGPKAATQLTIVTAIINVFVSIIFSVVSAIPSTVSDYTAFDSVFSGVWFILFSSTVAFIVSGIINNFLNRAVGRLFKKNPDGKLAFVARTYVSTFVGQFFDNIIFGMLTYMVFAPIFWNGFSWTFTQCFVCALFFGISELLMEVIFSPIAYKVCKNWKEDNVGKEYIDIVKPIID